MSDESSAYGDFIDQSLSQMSCCQWLTRNLPETGVAISSRAAFDKTIRQILVMIVTSKPTRFSALALVLMTGLITVLKAENRKKRTLTTTRKVVKFDSLASGIVHGSSRGLFYFIFSVYGSFLPYMQSDMMWLAGALQMKRWLMSLQLVAKLMPLI